MCILERGACDNLAFQTPVTLELTTAVNFSKSSRRPGNRPSTCHSRPMTAWPTVKEISGHRPKLSKKQFQSSQSLLQYFEKMPSGGFYSWCIYSLLHSYFPSCLGAPEKLLHGLTEGFLCPLPSFPSRIIPSPPAGGLWLSRGPGVSAATPPPAPCLPAQPCASYLTHPHSSLRVEA